MIRVLLAAAAALPLAAPAWACQWDGALLTSELFEAPPAGWTAAGGPEFGPQGLEAAGDKEVVALYDRSVKSGSICARLVWDGEAKATEVAGVVLWARSADDFYVVNLDSGGLFSVNRRRRGSVTPIVPPTPNASLAVAGVLNEIEVRFQRGAAVVFINGYQAAHLAGDADQGSLVGVAVRSGKARGRISRTDVFARPEIVPSAIPEDRGNVDAFEAEALGVAPQNTLHDYPLNTATPTAIPGGSVISTRELAALIGKDADLLVLDALGASRRLPGALDASAFRNPGTFDDAVQESFRSFLADLTVNDREARIVTYCWSRECWESYNVALRAIRLGYKNVRWYRGGLQAWNFALLPTQRGISD
jgi:rhodanese-related sulfurtransferase